MLLCSHEVLVLPSNNAEIIYGDIMTSDVVMVKYWGRGLQVRSLNLLPKVLEDCSNILFITLHPVTFVSVMTPLFFCIGSWSFGAIRRFLMVVSPLQYTCTPCLLQTFLCSHSALCSMDYYVWILVVFDARVCFVSSILFWVGFLVLIFILLRAHAGYLHFVSTLYRWSSCCCTSWGFELYDAGCQSHYTWMVLYGDCPTANTSQYEWASYIQ